MKAIVVTLTVKPGSEETFQSISKGLIEKVRANEPDCLYYALYKTDNPQKFVMIERYKDDAAIAAHQKTPYFKDAFKQLRDVFAGPPEFIIVDLVH